MEKLANEIVDNKPSDNEERQDTSGNEKDTLEQKPINDHVEGVKGDSESTQFMEMYEKK